MFQRAFILSHSAVSSLGCRFHRAGSSQAAASGEQHLAHSGCLIKLLAERPNLLWARKAWEGGCERAPISERREAPVRGGCEAERKPAKGAWWFAGGGASEPGWTLDLLCQGASLGHPKQGSSCLVSLLPALPLHSWGGDGNLL